MPRGPGTAFRGVRVATLEALRRDHFVATAVLARSVVETAAALWYLARSVQSAVDTGQSDGVKQQVVRLLHGSRTTPEAPLATNVLTFVDAVERQVGGFRHAYDGLSEMAHPNWAGTLYLFGKPDAEARACIFGPSADAEELAVRTAAVLSGSCLIVDAALHDIGATLAQLVAICERELGAA